ncbi:hypothetical protein Ciccas_012354 [Cichlidogyrus casuarinus]|uniref:DDE-1 domain-containing protein n=1 Tax=Cichlidogyrus casuarinus TaxID=1844966 RepID=A0ABD2PQX9_9PLAT
MAFKGKRALLVLDNSSGHTKLDKNPAWTLLATELLFLPPGTTLDQGILNSLKCRYKSKMHQEFIWPGMIHTMKTGESFHLPSAVCNISVIDSIQTARPAWNEVTPALITKALLNSALPLNVDS